MQRPIPLWIGGSVDASLRRVARLGNGWFPLDERPDDEAREKIERLRMYTVEAGRDPASVGIEALLSIAAVPRARWATFAEGWRAIGATHLAVSTIGAGFTTPQQHIDALQEAKEALGW